MAIRMTGLTSGLDTESIVEALVSAQRTKVTKVKNKLTKNEWTEEIWSDLNKKIYSLYTDELTKFKTQGNYLTKTVTSSDNTAAGAALSSLIQWAYRLEEKCVSLQTTSVPPEAAVYQPSSTYPSLVTTGSPS